MGCGQSKIENEEAVTRCKGRKQFMKDAISARNAFAAAHSAYAMSLKNTGAALSDYAHGEVQNSVPPVPVVPTTDSMVAPPPLFDLAPPPPPPPNASFAPSPLQRAATMPEMKMPDNKKPVGPSTILEEEGDGDDEVEAEDNEKLVPRRRRGYKGSGSIGGSTSRSRDRLENEPSPSSASPPVVETRPAAMQAPQSSDEWEAYLFPPQENMVGPNLRAVEEEEEQDKQQKVFDEMSARVEEVVEEVSKSTKVEAAPVEKVPIEVPATGGGSGGKSVKKGKAGVGATSSGTGERRLVKGTVNLLQIFEQLDDHFLKASESAYEVSKMLEATRLHYHSNFADNRGNDPRNKLISVVVVKHLCHHHEFMKKVFMLWLELWS